MPTEKKEIKLEVAKELAEKICNELKLWCEVIEIAGSIRRDKPIVHDVDLIGIPKEEYTREFIMQKFCELGDRVVLSGPTKSSIVKDGIQIDINLSIKSQGNFGAFRLHHTGSANSNMMLRQIALRKKLTLSQYGLFQKNPDGTVGESIAGKTEESIYEALGLRYVPPEKRD